MGAEYGAGYVAHRTGKAVCRHAVFLVSAGTVTFCTSCDGQTDWTKAPVVRVHSRVFANGGVLIGGERARFVSARTAAARTPQGRQASRDGAADGFVERVRVEFLGRGLTARDQAEYQARAEALARAIRADGPTRHRVAMDTLLNELRARFVEDVWRVAYATSQGGSTPKQPEFVAVLSLPSWPCDERAVRTAFSALALRVHPDHGGNAEDFIAAKRARDEALAALPPLAPMKGHR